MTDAASGTTDVQPPIRKVTHVATADKASEPKVSRSVERAVSLLHAVATSADGLSLTQAAQASGMATSTAARLLATLESTRFLARDDRAIYRAGPRILQLGATAIRHFTLDSVAADHLRELADLTGETAYLAIPDGPDAAIYLSQVESPRAIRHATWTGRSIPTAGTALGAALALRVNDTGFATSRATVIEPDAAAAAAPILDRRGRAVGAISIIGPSFRLTDADLANHGKALAEHAALIGDVLNLRSQDR